MREMILKLFGHGRIRSDVVESNLSSVFEMNERLRWVLRSKEDDEDYGSVAERDFD